MKDKNNNTVYENVDMTSGFTFDFSGLPAGLYKLEETLAPAGYIILEKDVYFRINQDRTVTLTEADGTDGNDNSQASISVKGNVYTITVKNTPGVALPNTGGPGTRIFTILGGILMIASGVSLILRRRKTIHKPENNR